MRTCIYVPLVNHCVEWIFSTIFGLNTAVILHSVVNWAWLCIFLLPLVQQGRVSSVNILAGQVYAWGMGSSGQLGQSEEDDLWEPMLMQGKQLLER